MKFLIWYIVRLSNGTTNNWFIQLNQVELYYYISDGKKKNSLLTCNVTPPCGWHGQDTIYFETPPSGTSR